MIINYMLLFTCCSTKQKLWITIFMIMKGAWEMNRKSISMALAAVALVSILSPAKLTFASEISQSNKIETVVVNSGQESKNYEDIVKNGATILTYSDFVEINQIVKNNPKLKDNDVLKLLAEKIKNKETQNSNVIMRASYTVFGSNITSAEAKLVAQHPIDASMVYANAKTAQDAAAAIYKSSTLYLGNGDAFRHTYWNDLNVKFVGTSEAEQFATAHESETPSGNDKTMDLRNNSIGRSIGSSTSQSNLKSKIVSYCDFGNLWRLNSSGNLVSTDSSGKR